MLCQNPVFSSDNALKFTYGKVRFTIFPGRIPAFREGGWEGRGGSGVGKGKGDGLGGKGWEMGERDWEMRYPNFQTVVAPLAGRLESCVC